MPQYPTPTDVELIEHLWIGMANIPFSAAEAKHGVIRKSIRLRDGRKTEVLEVICRRCRRNYEDVADRSCIEDRDNEHLIGGNPGQRAKRKIPPPFDPAVVLPGPRIMRRGIDAVIRGEA